MEDENRAAGRHPWLGGIRPKAAITATETAGRYRGRGRGPRKRARAGLEDRRTGSRQARPPGSTTGSGAPGATTARRRMLGRGSIRRRRRYAIGRARPRARTRAAETGAGWGGHADGVSTGSTTGSRARMLEHVGRPRRVDGCSGLAGMRRRRYGNRRPLPRPRARAAEKRAGCGLGTGSSTGSGTGARGLDRLDHPDQALGRGVSTGSTTGLRHSGAGSRQARPPGSTTGLGHWGAGSRQARPPGRPTAGGRRRVSRLRRGRPGARCAGWRGWCALRRGARSRNDGHPRSHG